MLPEDYPYEQWTESQKMSLPIILKVGSTVSCIMVSRLLYLIYNGKGAVIPTLPTTIETKGTMDTIENGLDCDGLDCDDSISSTETTVSSGSESVQNKTVAKNIFDQLIMYICVCEIFICFGLFLSSWAMPKDTMYSFISFNYGTWSTCKFQGSLIAFVLSVQSFYFVYFMIMIWGTIFRNWTMDFVDLPLRVTMHMIAFAYPFALVMCLNEYDLMNPTPLYCYHAKYPLHCESDMFPELECERGRNAFEIKKILFLLPGVTMFVLIFVAFYAVFYGFFLSKKRDEYRERTAPLGIFAFPQVKFILAGALRVYAPPISQLMHQELIKLHSPTLYYAGYLLLAVVGSFYGCLLYMAYFGIIPRAFTSMIERIKKIGK